LGAAVARLMLRLCDPQKSFVAVTSLSSVAGGEVFEYYLVIFASIWCSASVIFAIVFTRRRVSDELELRNSKIALEAAKVHYGELTHSLEEAAALRHDIKHHLNTISELAAKSDRSSVEKLVSETQSSIKAPLRFCGHGVADALLGWYAKRIGEDGIAFETDVGIPGDIPIESADLCVLLGNLLDNAHRAARSAKEEPYIHVRAKAKPKMLVIETENNFGGKITQMEGRFISAKENGGQGLRSVALICEKYHGTFIANVENQSFTTLSMLNW
jgi:signal transduction histidine kinase